MNTFLVQRQELVQVIFFIEPTVVVTVLFLRSLGEKVIAELIANAAVILLVSYCSEESSNKLSDALDSQATDSLQDEALHGT